jgi:hypothetical protein
MRLESARELKEGLVETVLTKMALSPQEISHFGLPARRAAAVEKTTLPTLALGVTPVKRQDFRLAVRVQRRGMESSRHLERIEKAAKGEVDVRYIGRVAKRQPWFMGRHRPLRIGTSIGHYKITAGTLGCFVRDKDEDVRILSNNHVLADENQAKAGDPIIQPGSFDGGKRSTDTIGSLDRFVRLKVRSSNKVDCATCTVDDGVDFDSVRLRGGGSVRDVQPNDGSVDEVEKLGRTTGHTLGTVTAFELDNVVVAYDIGNVRFDDQIEIESTESSPFSDGGDSGSLIFTSEGNRAFALLFAGSQQGGSNDMGLTYANPIEEVLRALKVTLVHS